MDLLEIAQKLVDEISERIKRDQARLEGVVDLYRRWKEAENGQFNSVSSGEETAEK